MHKKDLEQYLDLLNEEKEIDREIERLQRQGKLIVHDFVTGSNPEYPYQKMKIQIEGVPTGKNDYNYLEARLFYEKNKQKKEILEKRLEIEAFINGISKSRIRRIFRMRYFEGLTFQQIAFRLGKGCYDESVPRKLHDRYLEMSEKSD